MRFKLVCLLSIIFIGCSGSGRFTTMKTGVENPAPAKTFRVVEILKKSGIPDSLQDPIVEELKKQFRYALMDEKMVSRDSLPDLSIKILVEEIVPGDPGLRYLGGIFALMGKGKVLVLIKTTDSDGREIFSGEAEGTVTGGNWGGNIKDACKRIASAYVDEYKKHTGNKLAGSPK